MMEKCELTVARAKPNCSSRKLRGWEECHFQSCFSICELELLLEYALTPFSFIKALRLKRLGVEMKNNAQNFYRLSAENFTLASDYLLLLYD